jgi:hypothetical protein
MYDLRLLVLTASSFFCAHCYSLLLFSIARVAVPVAAAAAAVSCVCCLMERMECSQFDLAASQDERLSFAAHCTGGLQPSSSNSNENETSQLAQKIYNRSCYIQLGYARESKPTRGGKTEFLPKIQMFSEFKKLKSGFRAKIIWMFS